MTGLTLIQVYGKGNHEGLSRHRLRLTESIPTRTELMDEALGLGPMNFVDLLEVVGRHSVRGNNTTPTDEPVRTNRSYRVPSSRRLPANLEQERNTVIAATARLHELSDLIAQTSEERRQSIIAMHNQGLSYSRIADLVGLSAQRIGQIMREGGVT